MRWWKITATVLICIVAVAVVSAVVLTITDLAPERRVELLVASVANLFGTVTGAALAFIFALRHFRIQSDAEEAKARLGTTFSLHQEFNSKEMFDARIKADKLLRSGKSKDLQVLYWSTSPEDVANMWVVVKFYQRLWYAIQNNKVDTPLIPHLFGEIFYWWYEVWFESHLMGIEWDATEDIDALREWFDANSNHEERAAWIKRAQKDKDLHLRSGDEKASHMTDVIDA